ncbi:MAG: PEPxxWA-CTERM sorting domain-containing protein [Thiobacillus sp.]|nr:PEPxxWA-CTERM sorting domain-containing protein [Thiobacillus sp.]
MRLSKTLQNAVLSSVCAFSALPAQAVTVVDFNSLATVTANPTVVVPQPYTEDGFRLTTISGSSSAGGTIYATTNNHPLWMGSPAVFSGVITNYGSSFVLDRADGGKFDLISMDAAAFSNAGGYRHFNVYGYPALGGGFVHKYVYLDDSYTSLETLTFDSTFSGLNKIVFSSVYAQVDNINLSVASVPEADTWAMLLAGLGLVGFAARRRTAS